MPGKVKVKIVSGRNLPIMDRSNLTTDAYVEVKLGSTIYKTDVYRKSLNPVWNSEWFRFEMDDLELQDEPLQIRLMDHDTYSSNDAIGKVYLDLNPLLCNSSRGKDTSGKMISGWIPVYDTMHGIRGEVNLIVKVELFSDLNKFRQSSCGVRFFFTQSVPEGYIAHIMQGFVEELVVNDDPEYQWIDKIRTPRASNEARQTLFSKLSGEVQRKVGLKALELGGNAVIGYKQCFDLEGDSGIVVRGIGTAAYLTKQYESQLSPTCGEALGLSREVTDLQGYRSSFTKIYSRSLRRRGCPGRAPRLQRRSFRATSSSDSMSVQHHQQSKDDLDDAIKKRCHHDDTCCVLGQAAAFAGENVAAEHPSSCVAGGGAGAAAVLASSRHGSCEGFKERRSASFREDSLMRLVKFHLKKSLLTSSTQSIPPSTGGTSATHNNKEVFLIGNNSNTKVPYQVPGQKCQLIVATSEPCIEVSSMQYSAGEALTKCPSFTTTSTVPASPLPHKSSKSVSLTTPNSTSCRSRSTSRSPHCSKPRHNNLLECSSAIIHENDIADSSSTSRRPNDKPFPISSVVDEPCGRSRSALASCMITHHRTLSGTMTPAMSSQTVRNEHEICRTLSRSVNNLNQNNGAEIFVPPQRQNAPDLGCCGVDFESAGSNLDSNVDEDSTSDTSLRYLYGCGGETGHAGVGRVGSTNYRMRHDLEIESDTSKDFTKATSSGNDACSVDNDELSPVSEREGFLSLRKKRGSRRKDRYSKSSLMKRASTNFCERGLLLGGTERIKEEVVKFFKRKKSSDDNESCSSSTTKNPSSTTAKKCAKSKSSPYREAKFFFRKRRTTSNSTTKNTPTADSSALSYNARSKSSSQLFRSNSDSHSLGQTSLDSMPSVGSEPLFDAEDDDSTHDILTSTTTETFYLHEKLIGPNVTNVPEFKIPEVDEEEKENQSVIKIEQHTHNSLSTMKDRDTPSPAHHHNVLQLNRSKIKEIIKELGYSTESPLKLYISSMDALLVYDPADEPSSTTGTGGDANPATVAAAAATAKGTFDAVNFGGYAISDSSASALSQHSCAFKPAICRATADSNCSMFSGELSSCCSSTSCCSRHNSKCSSVHKATPSFCTARSPRFLCRHGTVRARPLLRNSESESTNYDNSALSSFSTVGSSCRLGARGTTTDSFSTSASESAKNSFPVLNQVICSDNGNSWLLGRTDNDKCNNCLMIRARDNNSDILTDSNVSDASNSSPRVSCPVHDNHAQKCNSSGGDYYHPVGGDEDSCKESILLYRAAAGRSCCCYDDHCEDILEVTVSNSGEEEDYSRNGRQSRDDREGVNVENRTTMKEAELNESENIIGEKSDEQIGVAGCTRSPIPEELLFDRTTPTQLPISNQPCGNVNHSLTSAVGGSSNANTASTVLSSCTATTNNISQNVSASSIPYTAITNNSVTNNNSNSTNCNTVFVSRQGGCGLSHHHSDPTSTNVINNATTGTTASTNNNSVGTCAGEVAKRLVATNTSPEENPATNGACNIANLYETGKESLASSSPCPPHPNYEPQHSANGINVHHRHPLHHQTACKEMPTTLSLDAAVDAAEATGNDSGDSVQDRNGGIAPNKVGIPKTQNVLSHPGISRFPSAGSAYLGPSHSNMTTTILTAGTGTIPVVVGGGGSSGALHRRSSESDLSTPPKPNAISVSSHMRGFPTTGLKPGITTTIDQYGLMEYPFITISQFPTGFLTHIGGTVTARSVKLLERISNLEEPESRDAWWNEIRMEIRAHCRAFGCTVVVGYEEHTTMCDDVCVLSASGTAAIAATTIGLKNVELLTVSTKQGTTNPVIADTPCPGRGVEKDRSGLSKMDNVISTATGNGALKHLLVTPSKLRHDSDHDQNCSMLHIPSNPAGLPFPVKMSRCHVCRKGRVPDVLIVTVDVPPGLHITGKGTLIQAQVFRPKKDCKGEISAKEVSDSLPFLEYELHRRLINKLKVKGMNAIFGLKVQICLGDKLMVAVATGTAMYVSALPPPGVPIITAGNLKTDAQKVLQYQKVVQDAYDRNRQHYDLKSVPIPTNGRQSGSSGEESDEEETADVHSSNKDTYILEVDDAEDIDIISMLIDPHPTTAFLMNNIDYLHGYEEHHVSSQQMFTQVWRCRIPTLSLRQFTAYFERLIRAVCFKLRKMMPCVLSKLSFTVELPEPDEMQISIIGLALGMVDQSKIPTADKLVNVKSGSVLSVAKEDSELMFPLEEDGSASGSTTGNSVASGQQATGGKSSDQPSLNSDSSRDNRGTPPPPSGILVPAVGQMHNSGVVLVPRTFPHQSCTISSSPHSHCSSHLSGSGCGHVNGSGTAPPVPTAHAPQLSKCVSGDSAAGNLASSSSSILPGHGVNYSFRGGTTSHSQQPFSLSRSGSKVIPKSALQFTPKPKFTVEITPLSYIPGARIEKYLGNLNFFFIRETTSIRENGGLSGFVHNFVAEVLAIVRAHVAALGGNAMVSYFMTELALLHNPHKNQGQCLINVGGDVVLIVHPSSLTDEVQLGS